MAMKLDAGEIEALVAPMLLQPMAGHVYQQLAAYVDLLYRWNSRMNLTAVREPEVLAGLHLGECLRAAQRIPAGVTTVLDFGSGAGLPGIPIQIARPELRVTLAESQTKKASFLRECLRTLELPTATVHRGRVEELPLSQVFDVVSLRAVDQMENALQSARIHIGSTCILLTSKDKEAEIRSAMPGFSWDTDPVPGTKQRLILVGTKLA